MTSNTVLRPHSESDVAKMFDKIAGRYDLMNHLLSLNVDKLWRRALIRSLPKAPGAALLDVATGTCDVIIEALNTRTNFTTIAGADISSGMLEMGRQKLDSAGFESRVTLENCSAERLTFNDSAFDAVTISFGLRNVCDKKKALAEFYRVLKPSGIVAILEFFTPSNSLFARAFMFYFEQILPRIGAMLSDGEAYRYLPKSVGGFYSAEELKTLISDQGFAKINETSFLFGACRLITAKK